MTGLGRNVSAARRAVPQAAWVEADIGRLLLPADWLPILHGVDAVVNAAGALQDGTRDRLDLIHDRSVRALLGAAEQAGVVRFVQISAVGAAAGHRSPFFDTKGRGDEAVIASPLEWTILRPGLVIAPVAYGGTALLRALAAFPGFIPVVMGARPVQTVSVGDVANAVSRALSGRVPSRAAFDLVEERRGTLAELLLAFRGWIGLSEARVVELPGWIGFAAGTVADILGHMGWRSPLRRTALAALSAGVTGDPIPWREATGMRVASLDETLAAMPAGPQERWFARLWLVKPLILAGLSAFWIATGIIAAAQSGSASAVLTARGVSDGTAELFVLTGSLVDIALGLAVLWRHLARPALWGMIAVTAAYLGGATLLAADLWHDPLGPLIKALPSAMLAVVALALLDER